ncbi:MAG: hypothetical protein MK102_08310 [Fuerstiella sp.]|nr:hypothetical protein [Fuerstiella sp.]
MSYDLNTPPVLVHDPHFELRGQRAIRCWKFMKRPGSPVSLLFRLVVPVCAAFILTILVMIASIFGDPRAPLAHWFDQHMATLLTVEFVAIMVLALLAMAVDRIRTLRSGGDGTRKHQDSSQISSPSDPPS